jgi:Na+-transporting NADH:ubiquinone oxidoreductase subunit A
MASFSIKKGLDIRLKGAPETVVVDAPAAERVTIFPQDVPGLKPRLLVAEGAAIKRGTALFYDKRNEAFRVTAPAGGVVESIVYGPRRALEKIIIKVDAQEQAESFPRYQPAEIRGLTRETLLAHLQATGLLALIRQRPFSRMANPAVTPKSIFVNGMASAPFTPDLNVVVKGRELAFQAGLDALTRLTGGKVFLCLDGQLANAPALSAARNVEVHTFDGPHPAGNTSVHISRLDPIKPTDVVWTIKGAEVIQIGQLLLNGEVPGTRIISVGGTGVLEGSRNYYRVRNGQSLASLLKGKLAPEETRIIRGDIFAGVKCSLDDSLHGDDLALTVLPEDRERHLLGWATPGFSFFSASRAFASTWLGGLKREWALGTNQHGELRPMVLTGLYDKYLPLNIMTDYLVRAVLANDTDEAIKLGLLETDPEDFAVCAFACPSKMDLLAIIRKGLNDVEKEGI